MVEFLLLVGLTIGLIVISIHKKPLRFMKGE